MTPIKCIFAALAAMAAVIVAGNTATAQTRERQLSEQQRAQIEERLSAVRARLDLTAEQEAQLQPILRASFEKRIALLNAAGVSRDGGSQPSLQQMRALRGEMAELAAQTEKQVATVLDERQMKEFRKIQDEMREQVRARIRERRR
ncbi:MAG TPA: hypothetical protein VIU34_01200 [Steroidobacter sp.]